MHNVESMLLKRPSGTKQDTWEATKEVFESRMYINEDGQIELPNRVIRRCLVLAAQKAYTILGLKSGKASYKGIVESMVFLNYGGLKINKTKDDCIKQESFVVVSNSKILRIRPMLENWEGEITLTVVNESQLPINILDELMKFAGTFLGLGDYRPEFGRFTAERIK